MSMALPVRQAFRDALVAGIPSTGGKDRESYTWPMQILLTVLGPVAGAEVDPAGVRSDFTGWTKVSAHGRQ